MKGATLIQSIDSEIRNHLSQLQQRIHDLPPEAKVLIAFLPGGGAVLNTTDVVIDGYCRLAKHYKDLGRLSQAAAQAFDHYEKAMSREREARARFLKELHAFVEKQTSK